MISTNSGGRLLKCGRSVLNTHQAQAGRAARTTATVHQFLAGFPDVIGTNTGWSTDFGSQNKLDRGAARRWLAPRTLPPMDRR